MTPNIGLRELSDFEHFYGIEFDTEEVEYILHMDKIVTGLMKE